MAVSLFESETAVVAAAERRLADDAFAAAADRDAYAALLDDYRKLLRTTRRLMRLSDRNERELAALADKQRHAAEEIARKNRELEALSVKLAKYLSPQVYQSVFSGRQAVEIASRRKKLSVLFADLADFTAISEKLQPEELTGLLNQYLTEMSRIAGEHGATIDKFVGDAIVMFFGDPESRGVREDALACVRAALAMQARMRELDLIWRSDGLNREIRCRIGIATEFCTVGNFGSDDRMDYTIIGTGVNLAARLERAAPPGGILMPFETYVHVRDEVHCERLEPVRLKGIADPVTPYRAVGRHAELEPGTAVVRTDRPHARIHLDLAAMTPEERREAALLLRGVLDRL